MRTSSLSAASARRLTSILLSAFSLAACRTDAPTGADAREQRVPITISAMLTADQQAAIAGMSVEVTGPAIPVPIVVELEVSGAAVNGSVTVPVGGNRRFTVRAFDATGIELYAGSATMTVRPGSNPPLTITLFGRTGSVPVEVTVGTLRLLFEVDSVALLAGGSTTIRAYVIDVDRLIVGGTVRWAALNPVVARVTPSDTSDRTAAITGRIEGSTTVVASYNGVAGAATIAVVPGPSASGFRDVEAGVGFTCAIDVADAAFCWGQNAGAQLGDGTREKMRPQLSPVYGGRRFASLAPGAEHACAVATDGAAWCWGRADRGELGIGATSLVLARTPRRVAGTQQWASLDARGGATCGVTTAGDAYCWGQGDASTLGLVRIGSFGINPAPVAVPVSGAPWSQMSLSGELVCGRTQARVAICESYDDESRVTTASAAGFAWIDFEAGSGTWIQTSVEPGVGTSSPWACGITDTRELRCWGVGARGQLGAGTGIDMVDAPTTVQGAQGWDAVSLGPDFGCGLRGTAAFCWGRNDAGQLGDGSLVDRWVPTAVSGGHAFAKLGAGAAHACGVRTDGAILCWGANQRGELGDGTTTLRNVPVPIVLPSATAP